MKRFLAFLILGPLLAGFLMSCDKARDAIGDRDIVPTITFPISQQGCENGEIHQAIAEALANKIEVRVITDRGAVERLAGVVNSTEPPTNFKPNYVVLFTLDGVPISIILLIDANGCVIGGAQAPYGIVAPYLSAVRWSI